MPSTRANLRPRLVTIYLYESSEPYTLRKKMRILVSGASWFVGRYLVPVLLEAGHRVYTLSRMQSSLKHDELVSLAHDFHAQKLPAALPDRIDAVIHMAASFLHRDFPDSATDLFQVNLSSTAQLLDYAYRAKATQFILGSTGSVYQGLDTKQPDEEEALRPDTYFPITKFASELLANAYSSHMKVCIFRLFFPYGFGQTDRLIPDIVKRVKDGIPVDIQGDSGGITISPIYIDDLMEILVGAISGAWGGVYNVASPESISLRDIAQEIISHAV